MRGELFPEISEELTEYIKTHDVEENSYLSEDYEILKQHYSIVLEYVKQLERKLNDNRETIYRLRRQIKDRAEQKQDDVVFDKSTDSVIRSLNATIAGLKSSNTREKNKREESEKLLAECMNELNELRGFKSTMIQLLNKKEN